MSTSFPTTIDTFVNPVSTDLVANANPALNHDSQHANINDSVKALEIKVGINSSADTSSIDFKLAAVIALAAQLAAPGITVPYAGTSAPSGWLLCDGSAVSRTGSNAALFTAIGTAFGIGDGTTTFNVPNLKGKIPYGKDASDTNFDALNTPSVYVGEKKHQLTAGELASHTHTISQVHIQNGSQSTSGSGSLQNSLVTASTDSAGNDTAHNNMPPYIVMNYIIKI